MRILFIETLFSGASIRGEPLGILQLSSVLKAGGHDTDLIDTSSLKYVKKKIREFNPQILAYSIRTGFHKTKFEINRYLKENNHSLFSIFGGSHATFFPECIQENGVDAVCIGEGEGALLELCNRMERGEDTVDIKNLWVKRDGKICKNEVRPPVENIDVLPLLDRQILYQYAEKRDIPIKTLITSRGCPFSCSYCYSESLRNIYKDKGIFVRRHSQERAILEIQNVQKWGKLKYLIFEDDVFTLNKEWLIKFLQLYKKEIKVPFWAYTHVRCIDRDIALNLKEAKCHMIGVGIESANSNIRENILNRHMSNNEIEAACALLKDAKIRVCTGNILGIPGSSIEKDIETLKLNIKIQPDFAAASLMYPFPGTRIAQITEENNYEIAPINQFSSMRSPKSVINIPDKKQTERLQLLFFVIVKYPILLRIIKLLIILPLEKLYFLLVKTVKLFTFKWIFRLRLNFKEIIIFIRIGFYYILRQEV